MKKELRQTGLRPKRTVWLNSDHFIYMAKVIWLLILFAVTSVVLVLPFVLNGKLYMGSDMQFHLSRIFELKSAISNGNGFPFVSTRTFNSVGVPLNLLYSPLLLYPFAILSLLISNQVDAIYVGIMLMFFLSLVINYGVAKRYFENNKVKATIFTYVYTFSSINFGIWFSGFTMGQACAAIFYPLTIYGMYSIFWGRYHDWCMLAIGMSILLYSHLISVVLMVTLLFALFIIAILTSKHFFFRIRYFVFSVLLALCLSSFFLVGFISTELSSKLSVTKIVQLEDGTAGVGKLIWNSLSNSYTPLGIGFIFLISIILGIVNRKKLSRRLNFVLAISIVCVVLTTKLFPWNLMQNTFFNVIQFPYRILAVGSVFMGVLFTELFSVLVLKKLSFVRGRLSIVGILLLVCVLFLANFKTFTMDRSSQSELNYSPYSWHIAPPMFYVTANSYNNLFGYNAGVGSTDYWPQKSMKHVYDIKTHVVYINNKANYAQEQVLKDNGWQYIVNSQKEQSKIDLPILNYHSYKVILNGKSVAYSESKRGTIQVHGLKGTNNISVQYEISNGLIISIYVTVLSWLILILTWFWRVITKRDGVLNENS
ncbi:hypothetical protein [Lactiplantibacillus mudanjiangensis]|uniref:Membrane protein [Lactobacillus oligofermentans DSM = LMG 22743] n=1 Tax=Lactiplantibacillus mudanjiangensis TaxID=1296538 RepID=A0A660DZQ9_9LACO|nr:hypothetical protein [Lactiplantibacillus mudanjiangensis]VDG23449.1 Putative membrane protein [Lactobacillus oligofermentans DSM = LMG 22743] [Lactiplantibacillus mudanjiangensis]VDG29331.1 Putative membrane protein [Lactobacillus oligofermentans DSM = LMG 22743] [Lactiplantibacillus mudanjiangensis]